MKFLHCLLVLLMVGCISTSGSREKSSVSNHEIAETTDLSRAFATTDEEELKIAEDSMNTVDEKYSDESFPYPISDIDAQNLLVCVRDIVERRLGGFEGTRRAGSFLVALDNLLELERSSRQLLASCESYRDQASVEQIDRNEQAKYIAKLRTDSGAIPVKAKITLYRFVKPTTNCYAAGMAFDAAVLAAVGGDAGFEYCSANNGRRWMQMALEGRAGYGAGGLGVLRFGRYRYRMSYLGGPFTYTKVRARKWAVGFGMVDKEMGEDYQHRHKGIIFVMPSRRANKNIFGLGVGYFKSWGMRGGFKFLPLGTSKKGMLKEFRSLSRRDLLAEEATLQHVISDSGTYLLRVVPGDSSVDPKAKFALCNRDTGSCGDLFAGKYFSIKKMQDNLTTLQSGVDELEGRQRSDSIKTALYASLALSFIGTVTVRNLLEKLTTEGKLEASAWEGKRAWQPTDTNKRGIKWFPFESLNNFLQTIADLRPMVALRDISHKAIEGWNKRFNKAPSFINNNYFRLGVPGVAIVAGGVMAVISGVKAEQGEILVRTYHNIEDKQEQILAAMPNSEREVLINAGSKDDFIRALRTLTVGAEAASN